MTPTLETASPRELYERLQAGEPLALIDVRTPAEFRECHATPARNVPLDELSGATLEDLCRRAAR